MCVINVSSRYSTAVHRHGIIVSSALERLALK